jgi:hypothetical protein
MNAPQQSFVHNPPNARYSDILRVHIKRESNEDCDIMIDQIRSNRQQRLFKKSWKIANLMEKKILL